MWNSLKSDLYRVFHTKSFYITLGIFLVVSVMIFLDLGVQNNGPFASFHRDQSTFTQFLYYLPKSMIIQMGALIFLAVFLSDEYGSGFVKNIYPIQTTKWKLVVERFFLSTLVIALFTAATILLCTLIQVIGPDRMSYGSFQFDQYLLFFCMQTLFLSAASSIMSMLIHWTRSKVVAILFAIGYPIFIYMILYGISMVLFHNDILTTYTLYQNSGLLPEVFQWNGYSRPLLVLVVGTILYNGISYWILKKKDTI